MGLARLLCVLLGVAATCAAAADRNKKPYKVVCYLGSWANYRRGDGKFLIEHINPFLCTHIVYGFAKLAGNRIAVYDSYLDVKHNWGLGAFTRFNLLKKANPNLSTLIAIGGWNEGSKKYSAMSADPAARATFAKSVIDFCKKYGFDGLDMDWEYPANRGGKPEDKENFVTLLKELKEALAPEGLLLSAAVSAGKKTIDTAYDIPQVSKYLDFINVMAYDLHGSWENRTGHQAPLFEREGEPEEDKILNVAFAMNYWRKQGADPKKLIMGMGTYGRSFTLTDPKKNGLGAPVKGPGAPGGMTREKGMLGYNEICLKTKENWTEVFVPKIEAPYAYYENQWVGYDTMKSIAIKVDYLIKQGFGGGMVWSLETDDFRGRCTGEKYPLLTTIYTKLNGPVPRPRPPPVTTTTQVPVGGTTAKPKKGFQCSEDGVFKDSKSCSVFHVCFRLGKWEVSRHSYSCGDNFGFDPVSNFCTYKENVPGC